MAQTRHDIFGEVQVNTNEWQPIETAPKDGREILVYGKWVGEISGDYPMNAIGVAYSGSLSLTLGDAYSCDCIATHWMPLPEPPK